jgi:c-di-GMP-binding flagellar brake protein YcgR
MAARVLASVRSAPCNKRSIAVAIIDGQRAVRSAFALGAHFVLYQPISAERAKTSFRAARALMKCERRRNTRVAVQIPVALVSENGAGQRKTVSSDISQGGMSIQLSRRAQNPGPMRIKFTLPGTDHDVECSAEVAWEGGGPQAGIRFADLSPKQREWLNSWLARHSPELEPDDPPVACKLTDLSSGGCYLEIASPFPVNTKVLLTIRVAKIESRAEGMVRVMHPEIGMGVEFTPSSRQQREYLEKFIHFLTNNNGIQPEIMVEPEGMNDAKSVNPKPLVLDAIDDPLLEFFRRCSEFTAENFLSELRKQRNSHPLAARAVASV